MERSVLDKKANLEADGVRRSQGPFTASSLTGLNEQNVKCCFLHPNGRRATDPTGEESE
jgi:hypothetical protein